MADTVGMTLILRADAKGVVAEMKNAQGAVIDTARIMRSQLKTAADDNVVSMSKWKEQMGKSRETAMFFTQSLTAFGPAGQTAQTALAGIGGALMGGGGVLAALALAKVAIELLTDAWAAEGKAAEEAAKKSLTAATSIADSASASAASRVGELDAKLYTPELRLQMRFRDDTKKINAEIAESRKRTGDDVQSQQTRELVAQRDRLVAAYQKELAALRLLDGVAKSEKAAAAGERAAGKAKTPEQLSSERQKATTDYMAGIKAQLKADEEAANERGRLMLAEQELDINRAKRLADAAARVKAEWVAVGSTISTAFADIGTIIGGAASSWMSYLGQLIQKVIQLAIAWAAASGPLGWLNAAAAGIAVISAVSSVPEFRAMGGPVSAGSPYIVGERGPELMVPGQSGSIVPNHAMGGITVNISATDAKSVRRLLLDNVPAVAEAVGKAIRDGRRFG